MVAPAGTEKTFTVHVHAGASADVHIELEKGGRREVYQDPNDQPAVEVDGVLWGAATFHIPGDLPLGYHELVLRSDGFDHPITCALIIYPPQIGRAHV